MAESNSEEAFDLFQEPDDFYQKEKPPTQVQHETLNGDTLTLRLVGQNPLWVGLAISKHTFMSVVGKIWTHEARSSRCTQYSRRQDR